MTKIFNEDFENIVFDTSANPNTGLGRARLDIYNYLKSKNSNKNKKILYDYEIGIKTGGQFNILDFFNLNKFKSENKNLYVFTNLITPSLWIFRVNYVFILFDLYCFKENTFKDFLLRKLTLLFLKNAQSVVCSTNYIKKEAKCLPSYKKITFDKCVLSSKKIFKSLNINKKLNLIFIGSNKSNKNIKLLNKISLIVSKSSNLQLFTIGLSIKDMKVKNSNNINVLNNISNDMIIMLLKNSDYLICTSTDEGLSYPVLDAVNHRLKVLCFDLPVFKEMYNNKNMHTFKNDNQYLEYVEKLRFGEKL